MVKQRVIVSYDNSNQRYAIGYDGDFKSLTLARLIREMKNYQRDTLLEFNGGVPRNIQSQIYRALTHGNKRQ